MTATQFIRSLSMPRRAQTAILHTRFWTKGSPKNNANNHPIPVGNIIGVHNGGVYNDDELFTDMGLLDRRVAQVDSEAIFATLAYGMEEYANTRSTRVPLAENITDLLEVIEGGAAIGWLDMNDDEDVLHVSRLFASPLVWGQTDKGSFVFASTADALMEATEAVHMALVHVEAMDEGGYARIKGGRICDYESFKPQSSQFATAYRSWNRNRTTQYLGSESWDNDYERWWDDNLDSLANSPRPFTSPTTGNQWVPCNNGGYRLATKEEKALLAASAEEDADAEQGALALAQAEWDDDDMLNNTTELVTEPDVDVEFIPGRYMNLGKPVGVMGEEEYPIAYARRRAAAYDWFSSLREPNAEAELKLRRDLHFWLRPGDWVETSFDGDETFAQVVTMPDTFPQGQYILRAVVSNKNRNAQWEAVYLARFGHEFVQQARTNTMRVLDAEVVAEREEENATV